MRAAILTVLLATAPFLAAQAPAPPPPGNATNGAKIFVSYGCYQCHGYAAQGGAGARLAPKPIAFAAFSKYIRKPTQQMPPYTVKVVTDQELADIYAFLLTIPAPPDPNSIPLMKP
jgi:mono/diheme cytochrome c family protein